MNVEEGVKFYLDANYGVLRPKTWVKYKVTLEKWATAFAGRDLDEVTRQEMRDWRSGLGIEPSSANKYIQRVRSMYAFLNVEDKCATNPATIERLDEPAVRRVRLSPTALPAMVQSARHPRDQAIIEVALELLLRGDEIAELRVSDVLDGHLRVMVEKQKGELQEDEMCISDHLARTLAEWLQFYRHSTQAVLQPDWFLFPRMGGRLRGNEYSFRLEPTAKVAKPEEIIKLALKTAGHTVPKGTGVHAIRRTCARLLFDHLVEHDSADRALAHVSSLMHHSSRKTTELYLGITGDRVLRNKLIRNNGVTPLTIAMSTTDKRLSSGSADSRVYELPVNRL